jgi:DNA-binding MurR/RpiR family transcriptional regulator
MYQSVTQLAGAAETSLSTVVRFCRSIGLAGFQDLKLALARETMPAVQRIQGDVEAGDSPGDVLGKVLHAGSVALEEAEKAVSASTFSEMVGLVTSSRRLLFAAVGTSAPLAMDAAYRLTTLGLEALAPSDVHVQHVTASMLRPDDLCLAISHTGSTRETLSTVETARKAGAKTAALTSFDRSPLTDLVDLVLVAGSRETAFRVEAMASRLVHLTVLDALFVAVALEDPEESQRTLDRTGSVLADHRF